MPTTAGNAETTPPSLRFPANYNVATAFIDRHIGEGRGAKVAIHTADSSVTYAELAANVDRCANALVRFDPQSEVFEVFPLPSSPANVRQILGRPGEVWGAESGVDKLVVIRTGGP